MQTRYHDIRITEAEQASKEGAAQAEEHESTVLQEVENPIADEIRIEPIKQDTGKVDIDNYLFQSEFDDEEPSPPSVVIIEEEKDEPEEEVAEEKKTEIKPILRPSKRSLAASNRLSNGVYKFRPGAITPYRLQFRTDYVTTQLDNSLLFDGLNSFAANPDDFNYPPPGILLKGNFKDLFGSILSFIFFIFIFK